MTFEGIIRSGAEFVESSHNKEMRVKLNQLASRAQLIAIVSLVVSVAVTLFAVLLMNPILTPLFGAIGVLGAVLSFDGFKASRKLQEIAGDAQNFTSMMFKTDEGVRAHLKGLIKQALEPTILLKPLASAFFPMS